jgi:hypothetical protein
MPAPGEVGSPLSGLGGHTLRTASIMSHMRQVVVTFALSFLSSVWVLVLAPGLCLPSEIIAISMGSQPAIDGRVQEAEWQDASSAVFHVEGLKVTAFYKHDGNALLVGYLYSGNEAGALVFPELLIDPRLDRSPTWLPDDWWFHVSGSDCVARGNYGIYTNCAISHPDWSGVPNFEMSANPPPLNEFEMRIPLSKLGVSVGDTLGVAFTVEYVPDLRGIWPAGADIAVPGSWAVARIEPAGTPTDRTTWSAIKALYR